MILLLILGVINASAWMFIRPAAIPVVFSSISGVLYLLVLNFFRSPRRHFHGDSKDVVVSSVDGDRGGGLKRCTKANACTAG